jgi:hypothetical protein
MEETTPEGTIVDLIQPPTTEEIDRHFSAMQDSVDLINKINAQSQISDNDKDTLSRNKEHLVLMLGKDFIANDPRDKSAFIAASE